MLYDFCLKLRIEGFFFSKKIYKYLTNKNPDYIVCFWWWGEPTDLCFQGSILYLFKLAKSFEYKIFNKILKQYFVSRTLKIKSKALFFL